MENIKINKQLIKEQYKDNEDLNLRINLRIFKVKK